MIQDQKPGAVAEHAETKTNGSEVQVPSENTHLHQLSIQKTPGQEKTKDDEKQNDKQDEPQAPVAPASVSYHVHKVSVKHIYTLRFDIYI